MKFTYAYERTTIKETPLLSGTFALVFKEDPNGKSFTDLTNELTKVESITDDMMDCLLRKIPYVVHIDSDYTKEDLEDLIQGIKVIDTVSLLTRAKMEKGSKKEAEIALERILTYGVFTNIDAMSNHELLMQFDFLNFDVSKYNKEELRKKVFKLAIPLQQSGNTTWVISSDFANNFSTDEQLDRQFIARLMTKGIFADDVNTLENNYVRALI